MTGPKTIEADYVASGTRPAHRVARDGPTATPIVNYQSSFHNSPPVFIVITPVSIGTFLITKHPCMPPIPYLSFHHSHPVSIGTFLITKHPCMPPIPYSSFHQWHRVFTFFVFSPFFVFSRHAQAAVAAADLSVVRCFLSLTPFFPYVTPHSSYITPHSSYITTLFNF